MPKIEYRKHGGKITWDKDDWLSGLHPAYSDNATDVPVPVGNYQLTAATSMNPYRAFGYAAPGFNPTDVTGVSVVTSAAIRRIVLGYDNTAPGGYYGYGVQLGSLFFQIDPTTGELTNDGTWPRTITSASGTVQGLDCVNYSARIGGTRAPRIFYSFNNANATAGNPLWNIGTYDLNNTMDVDFMTTAPATPLDSTSTSTSAHGSYKYDHPMIVGDDDILYIGDGNYLHAYDGADTSDPDGKFFPQVLVLPDSFRITSFAKLKQRLVIFGYKEWDTGAVATASTFYNTEAKAYFWDYLSNDPYDSVNLNDNYCNGAFEYRGTVGCFTQGRRPVSSSSQFSKMLLFNGDEFDCVGTFNSNIPGYGGVQVVGDTVMFVGTFNGSAATVYQWGSPYPGFPNGLNRVTTGSGTGTEKGALCQLSSSLQVLSTGATTSGGLQKITGLYNTGSFSPALAEPEYEEGLTGRVKSVTITLAKTSSGGRDITVSLIGNDLTNTPIISNVSTIDSSNIKKKYEFTSSGGFGPRFDDIKPVITWGSGSGSSDAPVLQTLEVEFETENLEAT